MSEELEAEIEVEDQRAPLEKQRDELLAQNAFLHDTCELLKSEIRKYSYEEARRIAQIQSRIESHFKNEMEGAVFLLRGENVELKNKVRFLESENARLQTTDAAMNIIWKGKA
jgi:hypothetical protein